MRRLLRDRRRSEEWVVDAAAASASASDAVGALLLTVRLREKKYFPPRWPNEI